MRIKNPTKADVKEGTFPVINPAIVFELDV